MYEEQAKCKQVQHKHEEMISAMLDMRCAIDELDNLANKIEKGGSFPQEAVCRNTPSPKTLSEFLGDGAKEFYVISERLHAIRQRIEGLIF